ncbi:hypothetical protein [Rhizobium sp. C1]|nr:hypothetical protein [Rhizobium sp. C1]
MEEVFTAISNPARAFFGSFRAGITVEKTELVPGANLPQKAIA